VKSKADVMKCTLYTQCNLHAIATPFLAIVCAEHCVLKIADVTDVNVAPTDFCSVNNY